MYYILLYILCDHEKLGQLNRKWVTTNLPTYSCIPSRNLRLRNLQSSSPFKIHDDDTRFYSHFSFYIKNTSFCVGIRATHAQISQSKHIDLFTNGTAQPKRGPMLGLEHLLRVPKAYKTKLQEKIK